MVEFADDNIRLSSSTVFVSRSLDSRTCFLRLSNSEALSFDRRINVCKVVSTDVVVVEIVLSWSAMEETSWGEDEVNDDCASVGDDMRDMDAEGEWPFLRWKYSWSNFMDSVRE